MSQRAAKASLKLIRKFQSVTPLILLIKPLKLSTARFRLSKFQISQSWIRKRLKLIMKTRVRVLLFVPSPLSGSRVVKAGWRRRKVKILTTPRTASTNRCGPILLTVRRRKIRGCGWRRPSVKRLSRRTKKIRRFRRDSSRLFKSNSMKLKLMKKSSLLSARENAAWFQKLLRSNRCGT